MSRAQSLINSLMGLTEGIFVDEGLHDPTIFKAVFLAGGPGSGKSFIAGNTTGGHGFKMVNSDDAFEALMKKAGMDLNMIGMSPADVVKKDKIRAKAKSIANKKLARYVDGRLGIVIDGTGRDFSKIKRQKIRLEKLGYDCYMVFVNTSIDVALERNANRARKVDDKLVKKFWQEVQDNIGKFQSDFKANFTVVDNNDAKENVLNSVWKEVAKFAKKGIKNKSALSWIAAEQQKIKDDAAEKKAGKSKKAG